MKKVLWLLFAGTFTTLMAIGYEAQAASALCPPAPLTKIAPVPPTVPQYGPKFKVPPPYRPPLVAPAPTVFVQPASPVRVAPPPLPPDGQKIDCNVVYERCSGCYQSSNLRDCLVTRCKLQDEYCIEAIIKRVREQRQNF